MKLLEQPGKIDNLQHVCGVFAVYIYIFSKNICFEYLLIVLTLISFLFKELAENNRETSEKNFEKNFSEMEYPLIMDALKQRERVFSRQRRSVITKIGQTTTTTRHATTTIRPITTTIHGFSDFVFKTTEGKMDVLKELK